MSSRYIQKWMAVNEHGNEQTYIINYQCEKLAVCSSCYSAYTNTGDGKECSNCNPSAFATVPEMEISEITNRYGYRQTVMYDTTTGETFPVCASCHCHIHPNTGQGTICDRCSLDIESNMFD